MWVNLKSPVNPESVASLTNSCSVLSFPPWKLTSMIISIVNESLAVGVISGVAGNTLCNTITFPFSGRARWQFFRILMQSSSLYIWIIHWRCMNLVNFLDGQMIYLLKHLSTQRKKKKSNVLSRTILVETN